MSDWRKLIEQKKFAEADSLIESEFAAGEFGGDDLEAWGLFYEEWGDRIAAVAEKNALYRKADYYLSIFASWATSGGEGTARMRAVNRLREKIEALKNQNAD